MVGMPRKRPRDELGTSQGHPGRLDRLTVRAEIITELLPKRAGPVIF